MDMGLQQGSITRNLAKGAHPWPRNACLVCTSRLVCTCSATRVIDSLSGGLANVADVPLLTSFISPQRAGKIPSSPKPRSAAWGGNKTATLKSPQPVRPIVWSDEFIRKCESEIGLPKVTGGSPHDRSERSDTQDEHGDEDRICGGRGSTTTVVLELCLYSVRVADELTRVGGGTVNGLPQWGWDD